MIWWWHASAKGNGPVSMTWAPKVRRSTTAAMEATMTTEQYGEEEGDAPISHPLPARGGCRRLRDRHEDRGNGPAVLDPAAAHPVTCDGKRHRDPDSFSTATL